MDGLPLSWARDVLKFSLTATASTTAPWLKTDGTLMEGADTMGIGRGGGDLVDPDDPGNDPRFRKLVEAILFSRRLSQAYNLVLVAMLLVFTAWHWGEKFALHRKKRKYDKARNMGNVNGNEESWSSSSSTMSGSATPPDAAAVAQQKIDNADESSPLLPSSSKRKSSIVWKPFYIFKSWLQYQPGHIPVINKTLPPNSVSLFVLAYLALNILYNFYNMPMEIQYLFVFADRCGLVFTTNLPLLYLFAAKNQPIKFLTGYSYESLNIFHRRVGELMCFEALLHLLGMVLTWYGILRQLGFTLAKFLFNRVVLCGLGAFIAYESLYFTSLGSFRQRWYEIFLGLHIVLQVAALVFLWFHHHTSRPYVGISLAIFLIDRLVFRLWLKSSSHPATLTLLEDGETLVVSSNWDVSVHKFALRPKNMKNGWKPNDHIFITIPSLSHKHALQAHPFTIFSAAPTMTQNEDGTHAWFTLLIRAQGNAGFTHKLLEHAQTHPQTRIRLDGPYGSSHALDILTSSDTAILIAGGSGIAVAYPLLFSLLQPTNMDPEAARPKSQRRVKLLWITHDPTHRLWVPEDKIKELEEWGLDLLITPPTSLAGRPDVRPILADWAAEGAGTSGVVVSGPDGLVRDVRNTCASLIRHGRDVKVQVEKFGW